MQILYSLIFVATLVNASKLHLTPLLLSTLQQQVQRQEAQEQASARTHYHNQDDEGFYSYGYSGETSAKAEYKSIDGSSKGFYSYVDSNGKLQTVEYEAGGEQGFKAAVSNLPKAPIDNRHGPAQVKDTPEVQMAKKAHFEAYRAAELRAAMATQQQQVEDEAEADTSNGHQDLSREQQEQDNMMERNTHEQQQLLLMMPKTNANENLISVEDKQADSQNMVMHRSDEIGEGEAPLMTSYTLNNIVAPSDAELSQLLQSYRSLTSASSSIDGHEQSAQTRTLTYLQPTHSYTALSPTNLGNLHHSLPPYYAALQPTTSYSISPNALTTLPDSASLNTAQGRNLPTSYLAH